MYEERHYSTVLVGQCVVFNTGAKSLQTTFDTSLKITSLGPLEMESS